MTTDEDRETAPRPLRGGQNRCSSLSSGLWVVPYAGQNPLSPLMGKG